MSKKLQLSDFEYEQLTNLLKEYSSRWSYNDSTLEKIGRNWVTKLLKKIQTQGEGATHE